MRVNEVQLVCRECRAKYSSEAPVWKCRCGSLLDIEFNAVFNIEIIEKRKMTMWRYREAIPLKEDKNIVSFDEGFTPLIPVHISGRPVLIKQDHLFPTGSYKDRGASIIISKVKELGIKEVVEDSSGNAGCAIAAYCAAAGINCNIFVPDDTTSGKLSQIELYGAKLTKICGSREDTAIATLKRAEKIYYASHTWNPFFLQGTKTFAFEVCEQLGWKAPDTIVLPVGNGTLLLGTYNGFTELVHAGVIDKIPRLIAIQSENYAPLFRAFKDNSVEKSFVIGPESTLAEGIAISNPIRGEEIIEAVKKSNGDFITVSEFEIMKALKVIGKKGFCIEPTSAAAIAGVYKYLQRESLKETIVSVFTGHGLKASEKISKILTYYIKN